MSSRATVPSPAGRPSTTTRTSGQTTTPSRSAQAAVDSVRELIAMSIARRSSEVERPSAGLTNGRSLGRRRLVQTSNRRRVRGVARDVRILLGLAQDLGDRVREGVERLAGLGLGRLDQQRLVDEQREVDRGRVEAVVEQALGQVERLDAQV